MRACKIQSTSHILHKKKKISDKLVICCTLIFIFRSQQYICFHFVKSVTHQIAFPMQAAESFLAPYDQQTWIYKKVSSINSSLLINTHLVQEFQATRLSLLAYIYESSLFDGLLLLDGLAKNNPCLMVLLKLNLSCYWTCLHVQ